MGSRERDLDQREATKRGGEMQHKTTLMWPFSFYKISVPLVSYILRKDIFSWYLSMQTVLVLRFWDIHLCHCKTMEVNGLIVCMMPVDTVSCGLSSFTGTLPLERHDTVDFFLKSNIFNAVSTTRRIFIHSCRIRGGSKNLKCTTVGYVRSALGRLTEKVMTLPY